MTLPNLQDYYLPDTPEEAVALLQRFGDGAMVVAGGTFVHGLEVRGVLEGVTALVDIQRLGLDRISREGDTAVIGAGGSLRVDEPRLSTTYDEDGRQVRAGLELWVGEEDDYPRRAAGEVLCGSTLDLGDLRLDCAFLRWRMGGRSGVGRYDLLRRAS